VYRYLLTYRPRHAYFLNNTHVESLGCSPNETVLGSRPQTPLMVLRDALSEGYDIESEPLAELRRLRHCEAELATDFAAARYKWYFDQKHTQHSV
jgi:hypothetical protein